MAEDKKTYLSNYLKPKQKTGFRSSAMGKLVFAFDFGEFAVKVAGFKIKKNGIDVRYLFSVENRESLSKLDANNMKSWSSLISREFSKRHIVTDGRFAVCTFGGKSYIQRQMEVKSVAEKDMNGLVGNEMCQLLALDNDTYVFQHNVLEYFDGDDGKKCKVWAVAMPKETVNVAFELIKSIKMKPLVMDIHANGLRRFLEADEELGYTVADQTVACIDYGKTHTEMIFIKNGNIIADTVLDVGDERLVTEARNALGYDIVDKLNSGKITADPQIICDILNKNHQTEEERSFVMTVEDWLSKVNTAITRFNYEHTADPVEKILIYGGSPQIAWLSEYLTIVTKIQSEIIENTEIFNMETLMGEDEVDYSAYLNALNLSLMD